MNIRSITNHIVNIGISIPVFYYLSLLIKRYQPFLFTGSTIVDVLYIITVLFFIFLIINVAINTLFIIYYLKDKEYIVYSTYELKLYEKSISYLEIFTILYPMTIYVIALIISIIILYNKD